LSSSQAKDRSSTARNDRAALELFVEILDFVFSTIFTGFEFAVTGI